MTAGVTPGLSAAHYAFGLLSTLAVVAMLAWGAWWLRAVLLPGWSGPPARLAESVIAIATVIALAQVLGTFGAFRRWPMLAGCLAAGGVMVLVGRRVVRGRTNEPAGDTPAREAPPRSPREELVAVTLAGALVAAQWATHVAVAYGRGITQPDSLWYHATFAARFVQSGRLTGLHSTGLSDLATPLHTFLPLNGSLVQAVVMLPFGNDLLSPLVNVGWAALALLAAWCLGRRHGVAALSLLGAVLLLGLPTLAGTQPGQAANDIATTALFIAAVALLFEAELAPASSALAGIAAGLSLGTKLTVVALLIVLTVGVVVVAVRGRRITAAISWCVALALSGAYWFVRNWVIFGNPVPWTKLHLGPFTLPAEIPSRPPLADVLNEWSAWRAYIFPGFSKSLGRGWFVVLALMVIGAGFALVRGRRLLERFAGAAVLAGVVAVAYIQYGSDFGGAAFVFMVRYFTPSLILGFGLLALALAGAAALWRRIVMVVMVLLVVLDSTAPHIEGIPAWPSNEWLPAVLAGLGVLAAVAIFTIPAIRQKTTAIVAGAAVLGIVCLGGGWLLQRHYFEHRYLHAGLPHDPVNAMFQSLRDQKVAVLGTEHFYPFFGADLSNRVSRKLGPMNGPALADCRAWRRLLTTNGYRYIVIAHDTFSAGIPDEAWVSSDPAVTPVLRAGNATVYRVDRALDPGSCS